MAPGAGDNSFGDLHALVDLSFLNHRNESFFEIKRFYKLDLISPIPHPISGGKMSPKLWARRGNFLYDISTQIKT